MTKYKDQSIEEKHLTDFVQMKWIRIINFSASFGLGLWMVIDPSKPTHEGYEKVTVALFRMLWGLPFGIILLSIGIIGLIYYFSIIIKFKSGYTWIRMAKGYYLFENRVRLSGLASMYNKEDLIVFHPKEDKVLEFKNYIKMQVDKYQKPVLSKQFNNEEIYWSAGEGGYTAIYKGENLDNTTSEFRGDDLIVKSQDKHMSFILKNYRSSKDDTIRTAKRV